MIKFLNNIINHIIKAIYVISLAMMLVIFTLLYPYLRWKCRRKGGRRYYDEYPSYYLWIWYMRIHTFYERFIF